MAYYILSSYKLKIPLPRLFRAFAREKHCFFLDSSLQNKSLGRYSILGANPFFISQSKDINPFPKLRQELSGLKISPKHNTLPFWGGAVGFLSYDIGFTLEETVKKTHKPGPGIPDSYFNFYNSAVIIDHQKKLLHILALGFPEKRYHLAKKLAQENFIRIYRLLTAATENFKSSPSFASSSNFKSDFSKKEYFRAVKKAKAYIKSGDIYQVNLAQNFTAESSYRPEDIYERLRAVSPSSFGGYFDAGNFQLISSSPERFLKLEKNSVFTRPMKGTRPRVIDKKKNKMYRDELIKSKKDRAELVMIVDLERNDLGRVCDYDSIKVERLRQVEEYSTVFQTTASISGILKKNKDRFDLLEACFPGGSITGCPKIRAMQIIEELEPSRRSVYTGAFGYLSFSGDMDFNILIRTILKKGNNLYFGAGGGIVTDSDPKKEYAETLVKAKGIFKAIGIKR